MDRRVETLLERAVVALEKLSEDEMEIRVETMPPVCPHCEKINPTVRTHERERQGPLVEFAVQVHCLNCNHIFYMIPMQSECVKSIAEAEEVVAARIRLGGYDEGGASEHTREDSPAAA